MPIRALAGAAAVELVTLVAYGALAAWAWPARRRALERVRAAVRAGALPRAAGLQRLADESRRAIHIAAAWRVLIPCGVFVATLCAYFAVVEPTLRAASIPSSTLTWGLVAATTVLVAPGAFLYRRAVELRAAVEVDGPALAAFLDVAIPRRSLLRTKRAQAALVAVTPFIVLESLGLSISSTNPLFLLPVAVLYGAFLGLTYRFLIGRRQALVYSVPIGETSWADLDTRVHEWAQAANVAVREVRLAFPNGQVADAGFRLVGPGTTLLLDYRLLQATEWRQREALIARLLYLSGTPFVSLATWRLTLTVALQTTVVGALFFALLGGLPAAAHWDGGPAFGASALLLALLGWLMRRAFDRRLANLDREADLRAAELTGDPIALMVAFNTVRALQLPLASGPHARYSSGLAEFTRESFADRIAALDAFARQPGALRVPWARDLVPAIAPFAIGPYALTVPLDTAAPAPLAVVPPTTQPARPH